MSVDADDDPVEVQVYVDPAVLEGIGLAIADELSIVSAAMDFLLDANMQTIFRAELTSMRSPVSTRVSSRTSEADRQ